MSRKRRGNVNPLEIPSRSGLTPTEWAAAGYGGVELFEDPRVIAEPTSIFEIYPDPAQPRRTVPSTVRRMWNSQPDTTTTLFTAWLDAVRQERGAAFDLGSYFAEGTFPEETVETQHAASLQMDHDTPPGPVEAAFTKLVELAASIWRDGLTNPITIVPHNGQYLIETGERRWLAYHLLHWYFSHVEDAGGEDWAQIPARAVKAPSVWRQASENNARDNLNAIGKARQFAILLMDLLQRAARSEQGTAFRFQPFAEFAAEQDFYAQVADAEQYRVPRGGAELLLAVLGLKSRRQLSHYRALLTLPHEAWIIADDYNLTEYRLRQILDLRLDDAATTRLVYEAAQQFGDDRGTVVPLSDRKSADRGTVVPLSRSPKPDPLGFSALRKHSSRLRRYLMQPGALTPQKRDDALDRIADLRRLLDTLEKHIQDKTAPGG